MYRLDSDYLTQLFFNSPAMRNEIINENVKAPHNCDWIVTIALDVQSSQLNI